MEFRKENWLEKNGFSPEGKTYAIIGDTYTIKEELKEAGCRFDPMLKWHSSCPIEELGEDYGQVEFAFDELMVWDDEGFPYYKENAKDIIERRIEKHRPPSESEYVGVVGERLRNLTVRFASRRGFNGAFGYTIIYTFYRGLDCLVWFTQKDLAIEPGEILDLTGTVKKFEEFRGEKTTVLSRCIIKEFVN